MDSPYLILVLLCVQSNAETMIKLATTLLIVLSSFTGVSEDYEKTRMEIEHAIEDGNFLEVKRLLNDLMPLIKEDIKGHKDQYNLIKKTGEKEEVESLKAVLDRKNEIVETLAHLLEVSPAAVRVKSGVIIRLLDEFNNLSK